MPYYIFQHKKTKKVVEIFFHMEDEKIYNGEKGNQVGLWERIYTNPQATIKENIDINNSKQFAEKTGKMKGSLGDIADYSEQLSQERAKRSDNGVDPIKQDSFTDWSIKRAGRQHPEDGRSQKELKSAIKQKKKAKN